MLPLKKTWLYPAIAGIALLASACANNAAPNYTHPNQAAPHVTNVDGLHVRNYDGVRSANFDGLHVRNGVGLNNAPGVDNGLHPNGTYPRANVNNYNAYTSGMRPYNAFTDHNAGALGTPNGMNHSIYQKRAWNRAGAGIMQTGMPKMGYVQTNRASMKTAGAQNVYVDRDALAQAVGNVTTSCPGVQQSTVLVTDEEIFVGLNTQGADARTAKNQAKMNAQSISPRYYKVYVTDNPNDIQEIARVASRSSNLHTARNEDAASIDTLIKRMGGMTDREQGTSTKAQTNAHATHKANMGTTSR
ncbi:MULTISPECIES: YhcN/YlaJ family sporulation lipoprotein [Brevibacillus]|uniref:YhcN/YlaJ family sporulation lipoprotein n=1 Tax=Brevibacillus TaxID=55080 RepID=UPI001E3E4D11|nr:MULTISPECIES: YhcN/YlaJ family sporulation lipoprotein [Brevibacillus]MDR4998449.1 YhcN/YlaJ family sporulation lipoprotein [Brevibacillus parabrevis]MED2255594.1 YhcN/YlaJ family sporulation lipoprotein [Brevibacillus parabrevis]UED68176.1 YhcN/YlaJ family sporulation lipoprotein [Brevibacillus sp. HD3.3A]